MIRRITLLAFAFCVLSVSVFARPVDSEVADTSEKPAAEAAKADVGLPADLQKIFSISAKYAHLTPRNWEMPYPATGDTLDQDNDLRKGLAQASLGYSLLDFNSLDYNLLDAPGRQESRVRTGGPKAQNYSGESPTEANINFLLTTYSPSWGKGTQFIQCFGYTRNTWFPATGSTGASACGTFLTNDKLMGGKLKVTAGMVYLESNFYIGYVGGSIGAGTLGTNAAIPYVTGMPFAGVPTPGIVTRLKLGNTNWYWQNGMTRSYIPDGRGAEQYESPYSLTSQRAKMIFIEEIAYKTQGAAKQTFFRVDGWYNFTHFYNWEKGMFDAVTGNPINTTLNGHAFLYHPDRYLDRNRTRNNWAFSAAIDQQVSQPNKMLPFQGWYTGLSLQRASSLANPFDAYFELRAYNMGPLKSRPMDMVTLVINGTRFSPNATKMFHGLGLWSAYGQANYVGVWNFHLRAGAFIGLGLQYTVHPALAAPQHLRNPLEVKTALNWFL